MKVSEFVSNVELFDCTLFQATENNPVERQDLNEESTLDLSLGLKAHDGENKSD